jgi:hypothetical protein
MDEIDNIEGKIRRNFKMTNCPTDVIREFKKLCQQYGDVYWVGLSELLNTKKKYDEMLSLFVILQNQIDDLKSKLNTSGEKRRTTLG